MPYQLILVVVELSVGLVALDEFLPELEVLDAELVLVVHELDVLLADTALHRRRHLHLRRPVVCRRRGTERIALDVLYNQAEQYPFKALY